MGDRLTEDAYFGKKVIFLGEAHFDFGGYVNKQNCHIWDTENPHAYFGDRITAAELMLFGHLGAVI